MIEQLLQWGAIFLFAAALLVSRIVNLMKLGETIRPAPRRDFRTRLSSCHVIRARLRDRQRRFKY